jgi:hypothetical protein
MKKKFSKLLVLLAAVGLCAGIGAVYSVPQTYAEIPASPIGGSYPEYGTFFVKTTQGARVPGLTKNWVPQGIAYVSSKNWQLISHYDSKEDKPSTISVIDAGKKKYVKNVYLYQENGKPYKGHAGGIAVSKNYIWISSGSNLYYASLDNLIKSKDKAKLKFSGHVKTAAKASFTTYANGVVWSGDFNENLGGKAVGYKLDGKTDKIASKTPSYILSIPSHIQGMMVSSSEIILSQSYGRKNDSKLLRYTNVLKKKPDKHMSINGKKVPVWNLGSKQLKSRITMPPLSEGLAKHSNQLYIIFESGAKKYRATCKYPLDHVQVMNLK